MPNTFSMSPGYIARYKRQHGLRKYPFDAFDLITKRLHRLNREPPPPTQGFAFAADARALPDDMPTDSVSLVITSPPYLRVVRYGKFNWIRLWLLKASAHRVDRGLRVELTDNRLGLSDQLRFDAYCQFLEASLAQCTRLLRPGGTCVVVIGDVETPTGDYFQLATEAWRTIRRNLNLEYVDCIEDRIEVGGKVTRIWGKTRGRATKTDRILILKKPGSRRIRPRRPLNVIESLR